MQKLPRCINLGMTEMPSLTLIHADTLQDAGGFRSFNTSAKGNDALSPRKLGQTLDDGSHPTLLVQIGDQPALNVEEADRSSGQLRNEP